MNYEDLRLLSQHIEDVLTIKEDNDKLLEFQSKLVDLDSDVTLSFSYEKKEEENQEFVASSPPGLMEFVSINPKQIEMSYIDIDSMTCMRLISELIKYNENRASNLLKQIANERATDTVKADKTT
jgi:hypothetical protein